MYKVVISDLDGTLLNSRHQISDVTKATLQTLVAGGVHFMVASGRHIIDMRGIRETLGFECDLIAANGAFVADAADELLFHHTLAPEVANALLGASRPDARFIATNVYMHDGWYVAHERPEWLEFHKESGFSYQVADLSRLAMDSVHKIYFTGAHEDLLELEQSLLGRYPGMASVVFSRLDTLEVMAANVNKGNAVKKMLESSGVSMDEAIAFGDGMNDLEMLSMVGRGFVMENATDHLKSALPHHPRAVSCDEDGVARRLVEMFGL